MLANQENWKSVSEFIAYQVSDHGRVRRADNGKILGGTINSNGYRVVALTRGAEKKSQYIHRLVAQEFIDNPDNKSCVDHIDHDKTNNMVGNLRYATNAENQQNRQKHKQGTSRFKGLLRRANGRWQAQISINGNKVALGTFDSEEEAALAYNQAAAEAFGEYAKLNIIE